MSVPEFHNSVIFSETQYKDKGKAKIEESSFIEDFREVCLRARTRNLILQDSYFRPNCDFDVLKSWDEKFEMSVDEAISIFLKEVKNSDLGIKKLPPETALDLAELLTLVGMSTENLAILEDANLVKLPFIPNNQNPNSHRLSIYGCAFLIFQYALDLRDHCPDFTQFNRVQDFFLAWKKQEPIVMEAISMMDKDVWVARATQLSEKHLISFCQCIRHLGRALSSAKLSETASACLQAARHDPKFSLEEIEDEYAKLLYNNTPNFTKELAENCCRLSSNKQLMKAYCLYKTVSLLPSPEEMVKELEKVFLMIKTLRDDKQKALLEIFSYCALAKAYKEENNIKKANAMSNAYSQALNRYIKIVSGGEMDAQGDVDVRIVPLHEVNLTSLRYL